MSDQFQIVVEIDPNPSKRGSAAVGQQLTALERRSAAVGKRIGQNLGNGLAAAAKKGTQVGGVRGATDPFAAFMKAREAATKKLSSSSADPWSKLHKDADKATTSVRQLATAFIAAGAAASAISIGKFAIDASDSLTRMENRLRSVGVAEEDLGAKTDQLYDLAQKLGQGWGETAEVYGRIALATKEMGQSSLETLGYVETLGKAVKMSGASSTEAHAAMVQLTQGMASGTLRGEELNSVLEQLPSVADLLAKSLGVTRGELRALGQEGKIAADDVAIALRLSAQQVDEDYKKLDVTFGDMWTRFKNGAQRAAAGVMSALAAPANALRDLARALGDAEKSYYQPYLDNTIAKDGYTSLVELSMGIALRGQRQAQMATMDAIVNPQKIREQQKLAAEGQRAAEEWMRGLEGVLGEAYPLKRATAELSDQQRILNEAVQRGKLTADVAADAYNRLWRAYLGLDQPGALGKLSGQKGHGLYGGANMLSGLARGANFKPEAADKGSFVDAATDHAAKKIAEPTTEAARLAADAWRVATDSMTASLQNFIRTGEFSFNDFIGGLLGGLTQIGMQGLGASIGLPGYASGGAFTVGGTGGTDSTPVAFMASPGERVIIQTPQQQRGGGVANGGGAAGPVTVVNMIDRNDVVGLLDSPEGGRVLIKQLRLNAGAVKSILGGG